MWTFSDLLKLQAGHLDFEEGVATAVAMKLLTHNMLSCHIKGVKNGYPFKIDPVKVFIFGL